MNIQKLTPAFKDYLWGGVKLREVYGKDCDYDKVAESWELSTHSAGESTICGGEFSGLTLSEYIEKVGKEALGENSKAFENFPVLIKFIDAKEALSIQVHPSDEYALAVEKEYGKTEMWYVMDCDEGACLYFGVNRPVTKEEFRQKLEDNTILEVLNKVEVKKGDCFFIEAGTIHAIGAGIMICEIQQNSNTTYRVYDYARRGADGKLRELHVDKAIDVSKMTPSDTADKQEKPKVIDGGETNRLAACKYFTCDKFACDSEIIINVNEKSFASLMILEGEGKVVGKENEVAFKRADSIFVPANSGEIKVVGKCSFIMTTI